jgi:antitoxin MazE
MAMRAKLVRIGNSRGVRLPKPILEASGLMDEIEIAVEAGRVVLTPAVRRPREGWAEEARRMVANGDGTDPFKGSATSDFWQGEGWTWPDDHPWSDQPDGSTSRSPTVA